jgi:hypothetical protein
MDGAAYESADRRVVAIGTSEEPLDRETVVALDFLAGVAGLRRGGV